MLVFGHVGLTIGLARVLSREVDVRCVAVAAMLPDIIDKPLRYFIASFHTATRGPWDIHSPCYLSVWWQVLLLRRTIRGPGVVALMLPMHLLLDGMWTPDLRVSLLWPWAGNGFPPYTRRGCRESGTT